MTGPATKLIHAGETDRGVAVPLTTPIYETTTFVFESADEVLATTLIPPIFERVAISSSVRPSAK